MACPFATAATIGGLIVGSKVLLIKDKHRLLLWFGIAIGIAGWIAYYVARQPLWLRYTVEAENIALLLVMISRLIYVIRVQRQAAEIPRFIAIPLRKIRPFALHPVSLSLKTVLLAAILLDAVSIIELPSYSIPAMTTTLVIWIAGLMYWRAKHPLVLSGEETLHQLLRRETRDVHEQLEQSAVVNVQMVRRLEKENLSATDMEQAREAYRDIYARYLIGAFGFELAMESALDQTTLGRQLLHGMRIAPEAGPPSALIRQDLIDIGCSVDIGRLRVMPHLPRLDTRSRAVGADYVRRGSRMGGAVLARIVHANLGCDGHHGARFLNLYGPQLKPFFSNFCDRLNTGRFHRDEAISAARETFEAVFHWQKALESATEIPMQAPRLPNAA